MEETNTKTQLFSRRAVIAIGLTAIMCWAFTYLAVNIFRDYAFGLFIWLPFVLGATSTLIYGYNSKVRRKTFRISFITLIVFCIGLLTFAWEGILCMVMAFPIGFIFTFLGHLTGYQILKNKFGNASVTSIILFLSVPSLMAFENRKEYNEDIRLVTTSIEINASPEHVWKNVIAFPLLNDPTELIFKTGIAYPINATIQGKCAGAIRYCNFSTGRFVEPIIIWDEPSLLRFSVDEQPEPMKELSFYNIHPNHLHGYWVSKQGEFRLKQLANGHTLLEGTTWYENKIRPDFYWSIWSDYIIHKIHKRVLEHIKIQAEK